MRLRLLAALLLAAPGVAAQPDPAPEAEEPAAEEAPAEETPPEEPAPPEEAAPVEVPPPTPPPGAEPTDTPPPFGADPPPPAQPPPAYSGYDPSAYSEPAYPEESNAEDSEGFEMPPWSARIDPFNWLIEGRLGIELEVGLLDFLTVELVPTFVVNEKPPTLNLSGAPDVLRQESNGIGPLSGAAVDLGLWLDGEAFHGYVLRLGFATYGYTYRTEDSVGEIDSADSTERMVFAMFGSQASWGAFTLAGGIGLGVHLNREQRCFPEGASSVSQVQTEGCDDELQISTDRTVTEVLDLHGDLFPVELMGRFSLGVLFD